MRRRPKVTPEIREREAWVMFDLVVGFLVNAAWKTEADGWVRMHCKAFRPDATDGIDSQYTLEQGELWRDWQEFVEDSLEELLCDELTEHSSDVGVEELCEFLEEKRAEALGAVGPLLDRLQNMTAALGSSFEDFHDFAAMMRAEYAATGTPGGTESLAEFQSASRSAVSSMTAKIAKVKSNSARQNVRMENKLASMHASADEMAAALARSLRRAGPVEDGSDQAKTMAAAMPLRMAVASRLHHMWRSARQKMPDGTYEPRIKIVDGKEYDIANLVHIQLPPKLQASNCEAANGACDEVDLAIEQGLDLRSKKFLIQASIAQHDTWMAANGSWADPALMVPWGELSPEEQEKDTVIVVAAADEWLARNSPGAAGRLSPDAREMEQASFAKPKPKFLLLEEDDDDEEEVVEMAAAKPSLLDRRRASRKRRASFVQPLLDLGATLREGLSPSTPRRAKGEGPSPASPEPRRKSFFNFGRRQSKAVPRTPGGAAGTSPIRMKRKSFVARLLSPRNSAAVSPSPNTPDTPRTAKRRSTMMLLADSLKGLFAKTPRASDAAKGKSFSTFREEDELREEGGAAVAAET